VLVVILSAVSLAGYVLVRLFGERGGFSLAGALGGLVASTAVTLSFSGRARDTPSLAPALSMGILLASTVLYARGAVILFLLDASLGQYVAPRLAALVVVGGVFSWLRWREVGSEKKKPGEMAVGNPVELGHAALLAALFAVVIVGARAAQASLGTAGLLSVGLLGGLVDVDSVAVASASLRRQGAVDVSAAASTYLLATLSNLAFKAGAVVIAGGRSLARLVLPGFLALAAATLVIVALR
jgi:uncharacterized membrane protein (DUF4010 family)